MTPTDHAIQEAIDVFIHAALGRKAQDLVMLDIRGLSSVADILIFCSGRSNRQVSAIGEHIQQYLKLRGIRALSIDGLKQGHWVLMDYGHVIIHIFHDPVRQFYNLESLWADARRVDLSHLLTADASIAEDKPTSEFIIE
jgi:ribosome-associated protein